MGTRAAEALPLALAAALGTAKRKRITRRENRGAVAAAAEAAAAAETAAGEAAAGEAAAEMASAAEAAAAAAMAVAEHTQRTGLR